MNSTQSYIFSPNELEQIAKVLKTIAHPVKLQILQILRDEESMDVGSLCDRLGINCEISMMSHHLAKMKDNDILKSEKIGKQVFYSIKEKSILSLFSCMRGSGLIDAE